MDKKLVSKEKFEEVARRNAAILSRFNRMSPQFINLRAANLRDADLSYATLSYANLSSCRGLLNASQWLQEQFKKTTDGYIVYKAFNLHYFPPTAWVIAPGSVIEELGVNPDRCTLCGSGVNFATYKWFNPSVEVWECLLKWEDLADTVVPFNTDGKARTSRLTLVKKVEG